MLAGPGSPDLIWTAVNNSGQAWNYQPIPLPPGVSTASLDQVTVNKSGTAVAAGEAVLKQAGDAPIVVVATGGGPTEPILLRTPGGQGTVTALTATDSGFVVSGNRAGLRL